MTQRSSISHSPEPVPAESFEIQDKGRVLKITWADGRSHRYHGVWLRDNGQDAKVRDQRNGQKRLTLDDIPETTAVKSVRLENNGQLIITFSPHQISTSIDLNWLRDHHYDPPPSTAALIPEHLVLWGSDVMEDVVNIDFEQARSDPTALLTWLEGVEQYGFALMSNLPKRSGAVLEVISLFGYPRETNYGAMFEVRSEANPVNLAYTGDGLQVHTDNPYRDPVPTLQLLAYLENSADGGESVVVDGFHAAKRLNDAFPQWVEILASHSADFDYKQGNKIHLHATKPMIERSLEGQLIGIRFNNRSCDTLSQIPFHKMEDYYRAYRQFGEILGSNQMQANFKLEPNQLFIVDNTRVLHGRNAFSSAGSRWLQGAYADKDALRSKLSTLRSTHKKCPSKPDSPS